MSAVTLSPRQSPLSLQRSSALPFVSCVGIFDTLQISVLDHGVGTLSYQPCLNEFRSLSRDFRILLGVLRRLWRTFWLWLAVWMCLWDEAENWINDWCDAIRLIDKMINLRFNAGAAEVGHLGPIMTHEWGIHLRKVRTEGSEIIKTSLGIPKYWVARRYEIN